MARRAAPALIALALIAAGCGEGGVTSGAAVTVYAAAPLCKRAGGELKREGARAGEVRVRIVCLPPVQRRGRSDLAIAGANARRATEDSTSVAYLEAAGPAAEFGRSIVESAGLAWVESSSDSVPMHRVLRALDDRGSSSPREAVREALNGS